MECGCQSCGGIKNGHTRYPPPMEERRKKKEKTRRSTRLTLRLQGEHVGVHGSLVDVAPDSLHAVAPVDQEPGAGQRGEEHAARARTGSRAAGSQLAPAVRPKVKRPEVVVVFVVPGDGDVKNENSEKCSWHG